MDWILFTVALLCSAPVSLAQSGTSLIDAYSPTSVLSSPATVPLGTTVVLVCRVGGVASGTQLSYTWTCPNGPCDVGEGNNPNRKTYGDRMVLNVLTSRDGGTYTCLVREGQDAVHESSFTLNVQGGTVLSSYNRLIPNNAIIVDNGAIETNVGDILPPDGSSSVAVIDCSTDNHTQPLTWTDGAGQPVPTSPNLTVYQTNNGSSAALHIDTTDTSTFTNGRYLCDGGMERAVNIYINQEGATIELPDLQGLFQEDSVARFLLTQATAARSERYISSFERTDLGVPLEVEFAETQSSGADGDAIDRNVPSPGIVYNIKIWSISVDSFSQFPLTLITTPFFDTVPSVPRLLSVTRILSDGFELNWLPPREPNGRPVYEIEYGTDDTNFTTVDTGSRDTHYNLTGLQNNTTYYIRVVAVNYIRSTSPPIRGNESNTLAVTLVPQPPLTPITTPTTTDMPSPGTTGGITGSTTTSSTSTVEPTLTATATPLSTSDTPSTTPTSTVTQDQTPTSTGSPLVTSDTPSTTSTTTVTQGQTPTSTGSPLSTSDTPSTTPTSTVTQDQTPTSTGSPLVTSGTLSTTLTSTMRTEPSTTRSTTTTQPSPSTSGTPSALPTMETLATDILPIVIPVVVAVSICALLIVLLAVGICCVARRRRKGVDNHKKEDIPMEGYYNIDADGKTEDAEMKHTTAEYTYITTNSPSPGENEDQTAPYATVNDEKGSRDRLNNSRDRLTASTDKLNTHYAMLDPADDELGDAAVLANEHAEADDVAQRPRSETQPVIDSQHVQSAEYAVIPEVTHSTPQTPPLSSQDYATIPDKEPEEGLYDTADHTPPQEADTQATPPTADYASIVEPGQQGADDTKQPPPVPAFDPDILYTQPDKNSKPKDGGYETIPDTPGPATAEEDYESVDMPHASTEKQTKVPTPPTTAHHQAPDFGYDTVPEASGPVAEGGYEAVDIPHTKTATAQEAEARKLPDRPTASRPGEPTGSIYETISDSTLPQPADAPPGYEAVDIPRTKTATAQDAEARKLPDKTTVSRPGEPTGSIYETISDSTLPQPADAPPDYEAVHYPPSSPSAQGRSPPVQSTGSDGDNLYAEPERTVEQRAAKDKADGYATVDDKGGKVAQPQRPMPADELYSTPDMSQKRNRRRESQGSVGREGPKDTPPDTPDAAAKDKVNGFATVDDKSSTDARLKQPMPADELYSTPDMSQKKNRRRESQGSMGGEGPKDMPPDTPTAVDQLYATPDMSKKQPHVSPSKEQQDKDDNKDATPPEVPVYQPITGVNSK